MNPALRKRYEALQLSLRQQLFDTVMFYHQIGAELLEIHQKADGKKYNKDAIRLILALEPAPAESLKRAMAFAREFTTKQVKNLLGMRNKNNPEYRMHWGHILILLHCPPTSRDRMMRMAIEHQWTPDYLHSHIQHENGGPSPKGGGAPMKRPASIGGVLHQMSDHTRLWVKRHDQVWCPADGEDPDVFAAVTDMAPDKYTPKMLEDLEATQAGLQRLLESATAALKRAGRTTDRVRKSLESQGRLPEKQGGPPAAAPPTGVKKKLTKAEREANQETREKERAAKKTKKVKKK